MPIPSTVIVSTKVPILVPAEPLFVAEFNSAVPVPFVSFANLFVIT